MLDTVMQQPRRRRHDRHGTRGPDGDRVGRRQEAGAHAGKLTRTSFAAQESGSEFTGRSWGEFVATCVRESSGGAAAIDGA
jgi:hypothetical protein